MPSRGHTSMIREESAVRIAGLLILLLLVFPVLGKEAVQAYHAEYSLMLNGFKVGELHRTVQHQDNGNYLSTTTAYTTGLASWFKPDVAIETSEWRMVDDWPRPLVYTYAYSGRGKEVWERLDFDWEAGIVHSLNHGKLTPVELEARVLDNQIFELAMRRAIARGTRAHIYQIAQRDRILDYEFMVMGAETLSSGVFGSVETIKVQRGSTVLWLAPEHDYLVVRIEQQDGIGTVTSYLTRLSH